MELRTASQKNIQKLRVHDKILKIYKMLNQLIGYENKTSNMKPLDKTKTHETTQDLFEDPLFFVKKKAKGLLLWCLTKFLTETL